MRNSHSTSRSATSTTRSHPQLAIADGYDFNRARSSESTEDALAGKPASNVAATTLPAARSFDFDEAEDRGVPLSPKKLPPTPPRDHGSPYRPPPQAAATTTAAGPSQDRLLQPTSLFSSSSPQQQQQQPFLRPSSWRHKEEDHGASIFRHSGHDSMEHPGFYTIQRSYAFDEDDDDESDSGF